jgi:hypothetical protein
MTRHLGALTLALLALAGLPACSNPVVDQKIADLGPEVDGVLPSEFHRAGQPCLLCHGPYGGASPQMVVAGTIFATPEHKGKAPSGVEGVIVTITDSFGDSPKKIKKTNCIGNFFITLDDWPTAAGPGFPLAAKIEYPSVGGGKGTTPAYMSTRIGRDGSCAGCHFGPRAEDSPGSVFCVDATTDPFPVPGSDCPGVPPK